MTNTSTDALDAIMNSPLRSEEATPPATYQAPTLHAEKCPACSGSGRYTRGHFYGQCFKCKGTGKLQFKTSTEDRSRARANNAARKIRTAAENLEAFKAEKPAIFGWFENNDRDFARAMKEAVAKYGSLTEKQEAACYSIIAKIESAREASTARQEAAQPINTNALEEAFNRAASILRRPRLSIAGMIISRAKEGSANPGALYVKADQIYLGKIVQGRFVTSRDCGAEQEARVLETIADPQGAAVRHGRLTGNCAICSRKLTDPDSTARGIGPICAERFGW